MNVQKKFKGLVTGVFILSSIVVVLGLVLKLSGYQLYHTVLISGLGFGVLGIAIYFMEVRNK